MVVGTLQVVLALPGNDSLKGKRAIVRRTLERARARLHCAAAEVGALDEHRRAVLGFAVVSADRRHARSMLDTLAEFVASATEAVVTDTRVEVTGISDDFGMTADARWVRRGASRAGGRPASDGSAGGAESSGGGRKRRGGDLPHEDDDDER
jgi:uncharacterized protein YlxP (DUF503 family)